jgi:lysophospholipase L1-like esterase
VLGSRIAGVHRALALVLLNSILVIAALELVAIAITRLNWVPDRRAELFARYRAVPFYRDQPWSERYWDEAPRAERYRYVPYVLWGHRPYEGETVNVGRDGRRRTPGTRCGPGARKVFVFGGSTLWGWGAPDWETIPAHLQERLARRSSGPVCVTNHGEDGFVSTQAVIALLRELQAGNVPDVVVFYDGVNDLTAAYYTGDATVHTQYREAAARFGEQEHTLVSWLRDLRLTSLLRAWTRPRVPPVPEWDSDSLAAAVVERYLANYGLVGTLAEAYAFEYFFFWQPHLPVGGKPLTVEELAIHASMPPRLAELARSVYARVAAVAQVHGRLWYQAAVFDTVTAQVWLDEWGHVTPEGNRHIAAAMLRALDTIVARDRGP